MPKKVRTHCPFCRKHTPHEVERVKKGRVSGTTKIARQKRRQSKVGNRGKFSKVPGGEKPTKKVALRFRCSVCKKAHLREGFRAGKFELTE
ncbi:MAG: 50S ribosomal protein L44e [Euryarchaeota archaeon]|nr:50S ribosomal protein L44e [Euryarchaeota archaeon]